MEKEMNKKQYVAPQIIVYGDVKEITLNNDPNGNNLDAAFPDGTARSDLTYGDNLS
jgi:hypothetical protein